MKKLTRKEEEIMNHFWDKGAMFVRELLELYADPKLHFNGLIRQCGCSRQTFVLSMSSRLTMRSFEAELM